MLRNAVFLLVDSHFFRLRQSTPSCEHWQIWVTPSQLTNQSWLIFSVQLSITHLAIRALVWKLSSRSRSLNRCEYSFVTHFGLTNTLDNIESLNLRPSACRFKNRLHHQRPPKWLRLKLHAARQKALYDCIRFSVSLNNVRKETLLSLVV